MRVVAYVLPLLAAAFAVLLVSEVRRYKRGRHLISARRLALRLIAGVLLIGLVLAVWVGILVIHLESGERNPQLFLTYWSFCLLGALALIFVMLADLREVGNSYMRRQNENWREFVKTMVESQKKDEPKK